MTITKWEDEARAMDGGAASPGFDIMIVHHHKGDPPRWLTKVNGVHRDWDTRQEALAYLAGLLLKISVHPEPNLEVEYD